MSNNFNKKGEESNNTSIKILKNEMQGKKNNDYYFDIGVSTVSPDSNRKRYLEQSVSKFLSVISSS